MYIHTERAYKYVMGALGALGVLGVLGALGALGVLGAPPWPSPKWGGNA